MGTKKKEIKEKPLEKMTAKELRELALTTGQITGVHGMNKTELIQGIKQVRGIQDDTGKASDTSVREIKSKIRQLKVKRQEAVGAENTKMAQILRKRIIRLKKKTRRAA